MNILQFINHCINSLKLNNNYIKIIQLIDNSENTLQINIYRIKMIQFNNNSITYNNLSITDEFIRPVSGLRDLKYPCLHANLSVKLEPEIMSAYDFFMHYSFMNEQPSN